MSEERRRYFRIDDDVALSFTLIDSDDDVDLDVVQEDDHQEFHMSLEVQLRHAMVEVRTQHPKLAHVLDLMNQKINLLRTSETFSENQPFFKRANISACGMAFTWHKPLPVNQLLMLNLYLQPHHELVRTVAHVATASPNPSAPPNSNEAYILRLDFQDIHSAYQEILIQHVVQRQGRQLRQKLDEQAED
ncbi:hypothetical protein [Bermanella sp. R86510]|uniref:hypothetical protein n=1 Tax=unclassified Bermanella TaxID=2627862 RepID=UPI0037CC8147